jgi:hypothetical protein
MAHTWSAQQTEQHGPTRSDSRPRRCTKAERQAFGALINASVPAQPVSAVGTLDAVVPEKRHCAPRPTTPRTARKMLGDDGSLCSCRHHGRHRPRGRCGTPPQPDWVASGSHVDGTHDTRHVHYRPTRGDGGRARRHEHTLPDRRRQGPPSPPGLRTSPPPWTATTHRHARPASDPRPRRSRYARPASAAPAADGGRRRRSRYAHPTSAPADADGWWRGHGPRRSRYARPADDGPLQGPSTRRIRSESSSFLRPHRIGLPSALASCWASLSLPARPELRSPCLP